MRAYMDDVGGVSFPGEHGGGAEARGRRGEGRSHRERRCCGSGWGALISNAESASRRVHPPSSSWPGLTPDFLERTAGRAAAFSWPLTWERDETLDCGDRKRGSFCRWTLNLIV